MSNTSEIWVYRAPTTGTATYMSAGFEDDHTVNEYETLVRTSNTNPVIGQRAHGFAQTAEWFAKSTTGTVTSVVNFTKLVIVTPAEPEDIDGLYPVNLEELIALKDGQGFAGEYSIGDMAQGVWISADGIAKFGTGVVTHIFENAALLSVDTDLIPNEVETSWGRHLGNGTHPALGFR